MSSNIRVSLSSLLDAFSVNLENLYSTRSSVQNLAIQLGYVEPPTEDKESGTQPANVIEAYDAIGESTHNVIQNIRVYIEFIESALGSTYHPRAEDNSRADSTFPSQIKSV